jgi:hypothetical protein
VGKADQERHAAKALGVSHMTAQRDMAQNVPESGTQCAAGSEATKTRQANIAAVAAAGGITALSSRSRLKKLRLLNQKPSGEKRRKVFRGWPWLTYFSA